MIDVIGLPVDTLTKPRKTNSHPAPTTRHQRLLELLTQVPLTLLIEQCTLVGVLDMPRGTKLIDTVRARRDYLPQRKPPVLRWHVAAASHDSA